MEPELKIYTIVDLRAWLIDNNPPVGLSEQVIAPVRAYAILNNPYVKDEDAVVAAIYVGDELAAFTASFPDMYEGKRIWWATTLWCNPKYQGQGYGMIVIGGLMEAHEPDLTFDRWGAQETVEIFKCLGYHTTYTPRYIFGDKKINRTTIKGKLAYCAQELTKMVYGVRCMVYGVKNDYTLKYSTFVDGEAYAFMQTHRGNDLFLREQKMLNWILQYPFAKSCYLTNKVMRDTTFSSYTTSYEYSVVKVYLDLQLIGVYILRECGGRISIVALYYEPSKQSVVFTSVLEHAQKCSFVGIETESKVLAMFIKKHMYYPKHVVDNISLTLCDIKLTDTYTMQMGDGDSFV